MMSYIDGLFFFTLFSICIACGTNAIVSVSQYFSFMPLCCLDAWFGYKFPYVE